jgi:hypothetical protein
LTKAAIGVLGAIAKRDSTSGVNTLKWPHRSHWTRTLFPLGTQRSFNKTARPLAFVKNTSRYYVAPNRGIANDKRRSLSF